MANNKATPEYNLEGGKFYYLKSGKHVATLDADNNVHFEPGMIGAHQRMLTQWMESNNLQYANLPSPGEAAIPVVVPAVLAGPPPEKITEEPPTVFIGDAPRPKSPPAVEKDIEVTTTEEWAIQTIPNDQLPPFSPELGVSTPGFKEYIKNKKLTQNQIVVLIARCERKK